MRGLLGLAGGHRWVRMRAASAPAALESDIQASGCLLLLPAAVVAIYPPTTPYQSMNPNVANSLIRSTIVDVVALA